MPTKMCNTRSSGYPLMNVTEDGVDGVISLDCLVDSWVWWPWFFILLVLSFASPLDHCRCWRFDPGGSLDRRVNCRRVPQPRWVGARRSAKGGNRRETGVKGETRGLRVCPAPRSGALAVGGYKRPRGREREAYAHAVPSFPARPTLCKRALDLPFIGVRRGSRCTMGDVAVC
jgi:hypothetical protein